MSANPQKAGSYQTILIDGGLDLISPKVGINPGTTSDMLNYEVAITRGLRLMDGYERYDGGVSPSFLRAYKIRCSNAAQAAFFPIGQGFYIEGGPFGGRLALDGWVANLTTDIPGDTFTLWLVFASVNSSDAAAREWPPNTAPLSNIWNTDGINSAGTEFIYGYVSDVTAAATVSADLTARQTAYTTTRALVQPVPGQGNVLGLFWYKDYLYAVRDYYSIVVNQGSVEPNPGDTVYQDAFSPNAGGKVARVVTSDGSWGGSNDATATIMLYDVTGTFTAGLPIKNTTTSTQFASVFNDGSSTQVTAQAAGLYRAEGGRGALTATKSWQHKHLGQFINFKEAVDDFIPLNTTLQNVDIASSIQATAWKTPTQSGLYSGWLTEPITAPLDYASVLQEGATPNYDTSYAYRAFTAAFTGGAMGLFGFGFTDNDIPDGAFITGIEVEVVKRVKVTAANTATVVDALCQFDGLGNDTPAGFGDSTTPWPRSNVDIDTPIWTTKLYGGPQSLFGITNVTPDKVKATAFGLRFGAKCTATTGGNSQARVTSVRIRIHYLAQTSKVYFWNNNATTETAVISDVVFAYTQSGNTTAGTAQGVLYLTGTGTNRRIGAQEEIRTYPATPGVSPDGGAADGSTLIAMTSSQAQYNVMDWSDLLLDRTAKELQRPSKYQHVVHNFYASSGLESLFGVSGAGPAFFYDETNFSRILTGLTQTAEKPRHIYPHQSRLFLGYGTGSLTYSDSTSPLSFDGTLAASSRASTIGIGSPINGLYSLNGDALCIFTRNDTQMLQGNINDSPYQSNIQPKLGGIEYSCQSMGEFFYCSFRGVGSLESVQQYGDFKPLPHSMMVWPFLRPRVQRTTQFEANPIGVINSLGVKNKAQYRLMFADAYQLTATYLAPDELPQYSLQKYLTSTGTPLTWDVVCAGTESEGRDRLFGATNDGTGYVYEIDRGNSFDGYAIPAYFILSVDDQKLPFQRKMYRDLHVHGLAQDYATFAVARNNDYKDVTASSGPASYTFGATTVVPTGIERPFVSRNVVQQSGRNIAFRFGSNTNTQFRHAIQAISLYVTPLAEDTT